MKTNVSNRFALLTILALAAAPALVHGNDIKSILTEDGEGNEFEAPIDQYVAGVIEEFSIKNITSESQGAIPAKKAVMYLINTIAGEKELDPEIEKNPSLTEAIAKIQKDVDRTKANAKSAADKAKEEKEAKDAAKAAEKAEKEKKDAELAVRQGGFVSAVNEGAAKALGEFEADIAQLKEGLPSTIVITSQGAAIGDGATDADVASSIGYLLGKSHGNTMLNRLLQFTVGDLAEASVQKGIYPDVSAASKGIAAKLEETGIVSMKPNTVTAYRQLAVRTPGELRNPQVDPSAYLAISQVNGNPKKMDGESDEAFKARKEKLASDLRALQEELKNGTMKTRKEVLPKVLEVEYANGLKERPSGDDKMSPGKNLQTFFLATLALERLDGIHEEGEIHFLGEDGTSIVKVKTEDIEKLKEEAFNNLLNIYVDSKKIKAADIIKGYITEEKDVPMGTDGNGKAITEKQPVKTPVYLKAFFPVATEEAEAPATETDSEAAPEKTEEAAAPKKKAKK